MEKENTETPESQESEESRKSPKQMLEGIVERLTSNRQNLAIGVFGLLIIFFGGYALTGYMTAGPTDPGTGPILPGDPGSGPVLPSEITTFTDSGNEIETIDGKPVIRLFSTTWCPHCKWITETYESTVQEYVDRGEIVAYHWELDINDDTLTAEVEGSVPAGEMAVYREFNPRGSIPTFVFGNKYFRIGNGHERAN
ncbi:hypothetical protein KAR91_78360, partial [Candidatus Pacearchaeota archaeon]|nr:hypothetical protein [Candidatus Pacearchaeota archaeon]